MARPVGANHDNPPYGKDNGSKSRGTEKIVIYQCQVRVRVVVVGVVDGIRKNSMDNALDWEVKGRLPVIRRKLVEMPVVLLQIVPFGSGEAMRDAFTVAMHLIARRLIPWILKDSLVNGKSKKEELILHTLIVETSLTWLGRRN